MGKVVGVLKPANKFESVHMIWIRESRGTMSSQTSQTEALRGSIQDRLVESGEYDKYVI